MQDDWHHLSDLFNNHQNQNNVLKITSSGRYEIVLEGDFSPLHVHFHSHVFINLNKKLFD